MVQNSTKKILQKISNMLKLYGILNLNLTIQKIGKIKKYGGGILKVLFYSFLSSNFVKQKY